MRVATVGDEDFAEVCWPRVGRHGGVDDVGIMLRERVRELTGEYARGARVQAMSSIERCSVNVVCVTVWLGLPCLIVVFLLSFSFSSKGKSS